MNNSFKELCDKYNANFNSSLQVKAIVHMCKRIGISHGKSHLKMVSGENNPFSLTAPIGSETISAGKVYIKVSNNPTVSGKSRTHDGGNWVIKRRWVYEQAYGVLPKGYLIVSLDGDKNNYDPQNLYAISRSANMIMCSFKWYSKDPVRTLTAIRYCELQEALKSNKGGS